MFNEKFSVVVDLNDEVLQKTQMRLTRYGILISDVYVADMNDSVGVRTGEVYLMECRGDTKKINKLRGHYSFIQDHHETERVLFA